MTAANLLLLTTLFLIFIWLRVQYKARKLGQFLAAMILCVAWIGLLNSFGRHGTFANFETFPPKFIFFFPGLIVFSSFLAFSRFGDAVIRQVTIAKLVLFQSFRIVAEIILMLAFKEGLAPVQMTFKGYQFDILTGISALGLGLFLAKKSASHTKLVWAFNIMGLVFLAGIAFIATTSMPSKLRLFMNEPSNIWVTGYPYILLPGVLVLAALTGHLVLIRKLRSKL